jgi:hypothetical protein
MSLPLPVTTPTMPPSKGMYAPLRVRLLRWNGLFANCPDFSAETAKHECVSEDALQHLKTYKYSSVDKSYISRYILKHYVRFLRTHTTAISLTVIIVEWLRGASTALDRAESRHIIRLLLHTGKCRVARTIRTGSGRTGKLRGRSLRTRQEAYNRTGAVMGVLQFRLWHVDVRKSGDRA